MNIKIFADLIECAYGVQVLSTQCQVEKPRTEISEDGNTFTFHPNKQSIYCLTDCGVFELHVTYLQHTLTGERRMHFTTYLESSLTVVPFETVKELVEMQLGTEGFLNGCKDENVTIESL